MPAFVAAEMIGAAALAQAGMGQRQAFLGDLEQIAIPDPGLEAEAGHLDPQGLALMRVPVLGDGPGGVQADIVVEEADPERRQRPQPIPLEPAAAPHLDTTLAP